MWNPNTSCTFTTDSDGEAPYAMSWDDATWVLTSSFIIFTMQSGKLFVPYWSSCCTFSPLSGFGLLEAGAVSAKNEVNILVKNAIDVIFGGITYWAFGYGLTFGETPSDRSVF